MLFSREGHRNHYRPGSMIDSESAWTVVVPLEARFQIARQAGVEVTGARDTADDVYDSFVVIHGADGCMTRAARSRA